MKKSEAEQIREHNERRAKALQFVDRGEFAAKIDDLERATSQAFQCLAMALGTAIGVDKWRAILSATLIATEGTRTSLAQRLLDDALRAATVHAQQRQHRPD